MLGCYRSVFEKTKEMVTLKCVSMIASLFISATFAGNQDANVPCSLAISDRCLKPKCRKLNKSSKRKNHPSCCPASFLSSKHMYGEHETGPSDSDSDSDSDSGSDSDSDSILFNLGTDKNRTDSTKKFKEKGLCFSAFRSSKGSHATQGFDRIAFCIRHYFMRCVSFFAHNRMFFFLIESIVGDAWKGENIRTGCANAR